MSNENLGNLGIGVRRAAAWLLALGGLGMAPGVCLADTITVYVYDFELSTVPLSEPAIDPVIMVGDTIRWVWLHDFHNVVACVGQGDFWESDVFSMGDTFVHTFDTPGVFQYYCQPHGRDNFDGTYEGMGGSVTVLVPSPSGAGVLCLVGLAAARRRRRAAIG